MDWIKIKEELKKSKGNGVINIARGNSTINSESTVIINGAIIEEKEEE